MSTGRRSFHVQRRGDVGPTVPSGWAQHVRELRASSLVGRHVGSLHTGWDLYTLGAPGHVGTHVHSTEQSFFVLAGQPVLTVENRTHRLSAGECGLLPVGVPHAWRNETPGEAIWLEVTAPAPRLSGPPDTFWTGQPAPPMSTPGSGYLRPTDAHLLPPRPDRHGPGQPRTGARVPRIPPPRYRARAIPRDPVAPTSVQLFLQVQPRLGLGQTIQLASGVIWERLTPPSPQDVDFVSATYEVGGESCPEDSLVRHSGCEYGHVVAGRLGVTVGFATYELGRGDSITFESTMPHRLFNAGEVRVEAIWFVVGRRGDPRIIRNTD